MNIKYLRAIEDLEKYGITKMKGCGNSMTPIIKNGDYLVFRRQNNYSVGDIVFCKVRGRIIDGHKITKIDANKGYMISNNHGWDNGWTHIIYGKVIRNDGKMKGFEKCSTCKNRKEETGKEDMCKIPQNALPIRLLKILMDKCIFYKEA